MPRCAHSHPPSVSMRSSARMPSCACTSTPPEASRDAMRLLQARRLESTSSPPCTRGRCVSSPTRPSCLKHCITACLHMCSAKPLPLGPHAPCINAHHLPYLAQCRVGRRTASTPATGWSSPAAWTAVTPRSLMRSSYQARQPLGATCASAWAVSDGRSNSAPTPASRVAPCRPS